MSKIEEKIDKAARECHYQRSPKRDMNTEDFVTYEQAVRLKELGFDCDCSYYYEKGILTPAFEEIAIKSNHIYPFDATWRVSVDSLSGNYNFTNGIFSAPTIAQAAKWLREEKGLFIEIWLCAAGYSWIIEKCGNLNCNGTYVAGHDEESGDDVDSGLFTTYEKALSAGIDEALKLIEK